MSIDVGLLGLGVFLPALCFSMVATWIFSNCIKSKRKETKPELPPEILSREGKLTHRN